MFRFALQFVVITEQHGGGTPPFPGVTRTGRGERHGGGSERITTKKGQIDPMNSYSVLADLEPLLVLKGGGSFFYSTFFSNNVPSAKFIFIGNLTEYIECYYMSYIGGEENKSI